MTTPKYDMELHSIVQTLSAIEEHLSAVPKIADALERLAASLAGETDPVALLLQSRDLSRKEQTRLILEVLQPVAAAVGSPFKIIDDKPTRGEKQSCQ